LIQLISKGYAKEERRGAKRSEKINFQNISGVYKNIFSPVLLDNREIFVTMYFFTTYCA